MCSRAPWDRHSSSNILKRYISSYVAAFAPRSPGHRYARTPPHGSPLLVLSMAVSGLTDERLDTYCQTDPLKNHYNQLTHNNIACGSNLLITSRTCRVGALPNMRRTTEAGRHTKIRARRNRGRLGGCLPGTLDLLL